MKFLRLLILLSLVFYNATNTINFKNILKNPFTQNYQEVTTKELPCAKHNAIEIENEIGAITITSWKQSKIVIEAQKTGQEELVRQTKIQTSTHHDKLKIKPFSPDDLQNITIDLHILVPEGVSLSSISTQNGSIKIKHIKGPMTVSTQNGDIEIINAQKTVIVQNGKGNVNIKQMHLPEKSALIIDVTNGNVDLSLAPGIEANLNLQTAKGMITSEQKVMLNETSAKLDRLTWENMAKNVQAKLGNGGASITVKVSQRGDISLSEY